MPEPYPGPNEEMLAAQVRVCTGPHQSRPLGLKPGDAAYLLTGLREDVAEDLVLVMLAGRPSGTDPQSRGNRT